MTLPASGPLSYNNVNTVMGRGSGAAIDMAFIYNNTKSGQQSYALSNYYGKNWYQRNADGNCNNGNCACNCNCFGWDFPQNCANCLNCTNVNCANCDGRAWLQNNCNCACTYNCNITGAWQNNCNCNCACDCGTCFPEDALVTMADGTQKRIDQVRVGDVVDGGYGYKNRVQMFHAARIGKAKLYIINGRHRTTGEHKHWTTDGWAVIDLLTGKSPTAFLMNVDNEGTKELRKNTKLQHTPTLQLKVGMILLTTNGEELIESIEVDHTFREDSFVYTLVTDGSHTHIVSGNIIVGAWVRDVDFDFSTWTPRERNENDASNIDLNVIASFYKPNRRSQTARPA